MPLSRPALFAFGLVSVPLASASFSVVLYLTPYYAAVSGMSLAMIGFILSLTRISDVFIDPLIGLWSDRTPSHLGRRGLWMSLGVPVMALFPDFAHTIFGLVSGACFFIPGLKYYRQRRWDSRVAT